MKLPEISRRAMIAGGLSVGLTQIGSAAESRKIETSRPLRILSIDGGGMRGVVPAKFIDVLETASGKPITELFDIFVGASTGALLALGLNVADAKGNQRYSARDILQLYDECGPIIFNKKRGLMAWISGITKPNYDPSGLESLLLKYFGHAAISDAIREVAIPAIHLEEMRMEVFTRNNARIRATDNFTMRSIVRAATAAPTYFPAASISSTNGARNGTYVDAATSTNNPTLVALAESKSQRKNAPIILVSLGTGNITKPLDAVKAKTWGELEWVQAVFDLQSDAQTSYTDHIVKELLVNSDDHFFRFQIGLREMPIAMDDTKKEHLNELKDSVMREIERRRSEIDLLLSKVVV